MKKPNLKIIIGCVLLISAIYILFYRPAYFSATIWGSRFEAVTLIDAQGKESPIDLDAHPEIQRGSFLSSFLANRFRRTYLSKPETQTSIVLSVTGKDKNGNLMKRNARFYEDGHVELNTFGNDADIKSGMYKLASDHPIDYAALVESLQVIMKNP